MATKIGTLQERSFYYENYYLQTLPLYYDTSFVYRSDYGRICFVALGLVREMHDFYVLTALSIKCSKLKNESINVCLDFINLNDVTRTEELKINFGSFQYNPSICTAEVVDTVELIIGRYESEIARSPFSATISPGLKITFKKR